MALSTAMPGRPKTPLRLTEEDRSALEAIVKRPSSPQKIVSRARCVLLSAKGWPNSDIAPEVGLCAHSVGKWRRRFIEFGVDGLVDQPRPKEKLRVPDEKVHDLIRRTLETKPDNATHWSTRSMAKHVGLSQTVVSKIWRAFHIKPHRTQTFTLSTDPLFVDKVRDIVGLYMNPPENAAVLCVDEKSQIQALERTQPLLPMTPNHPERHTPTYLRHGTTTLFAALDIATGKVIGSCHQKHRAKEFIKFLGKINKEVPKDMEVHVVLDNYATHGTEKVLAWRKRHPRFHFHFTPTYSSWLNQVERWFGLLSERKIKRGSHRSTRALRKAIVEFIDAHNEEPKPFIWGKTADQILASVSRHCIRTIEREDM